MDWNFAIEKHKEALKRVLAMLVAMAAFSESSKTLSRHLHRAILRLLRPAEAAARRLIVIAARGLTVQIAPPRQPIPVRLPLRIVGTGIVDTGISVRQLGLANVALPPVRKPRDLSRPPALPLTDTLRGLPRRRYVVATSVPRISGFSYAPRFIPPPPPSANDLLDGTSVHRRLAAIAHVLDDLPAQARRFARWRALRERARARGAFARVTPMRPGRPPGWRKPGTRRAHEVHRVLDELHGLAFWALEQKLDTS